MAANVEHWRALVWPLISIGPGNCFWLRAYATFVLLNLGISFCGFVNGGMFVGFSAGPIFTFMLRLKAGEFAIGMWVSRRSVTLVNLET